MNEHDLAIQRALIAAKSALAVLCGDPDTADFLSATDPGALSQGREAIALLNAALERKP